MQIPYIQILKLSSAYSKIYETDVVGLLDIIFHKTSNSSFELGPLRAIGMSVKHLNDSSGFALCGEFKMSGLKDGIL